MDAYLLHCINHVSMAAGLIKKNNERLKAGCADGGDTPRDQGFTRAKVRASASDSCMQRQCVHRSARVVIFY